MFDGEGLICGNDDTIYVTSFDTTDHKMATAFLKTKYCYCTNAII